jgi:hypothetical protein
VEWRSKREDLATRPKGKDEVDEVDQFVQPVLDDHDRLVALRFEGGDSVDDLAGAHRVEICRGLIEDEETGLHRQH